ncbi:Nn.00g006690.m01.CDS01 [Neocucurbitaria sp. VM-36]
MASRTSTPQSRSRSSTGSSSSSDTTMIDAPPQSPSRPVRLRNPSTSNPSTTGPTTTSKPTFNLLLSLPRELRDRIYTFALTSPSPFWWPNPSPVKHDHNVAPNLLRTSKQVYEEAVSIMYSGNKFLFTHPSDCNIFRVVASPASQNITSVYFRIREKDLRLWTHYLGSKSQDRSLRADLPRLKSLWIFLRCGSMGTPAMLGQLGGAQALQGAAGGLGNLPPGIQMQVQAVQNALGQQVQALQQQVQGLAQAIPPPTPQLVGMDANAAGNGNGNQIPPPPPPPPAMPFVQFAQGGFNPVQGHGHHNHAPVPVPHQHGTQNNPPNPNPIAQHLAHTQHANNVPPPPPLHHHPLAPVPGQLIPQVLAQLPVPGTHAHHHQHHPHTLYTTFLRFEREIGLESLCLSLQETLRERSTQASADDTPISASASNSPSPSSPSTYSPNASSAPSTTTPAPEVKIVCIMRIPRREVERLVRLYPGELSVDERSGDARTKFRKLHGVEVCLELNGYPIPAAGGIGAGEDGGLGM